MINTNTDLFITTFDFILRIIYTLLILLGHCVNE